MKVIIAVPQQEAEVERTGGYESLLFSFTSALTNPRFINDC